MDPTEAGRRQAARWLILRLDINHLSDRMNLGVIAMPADEELALPQLVQQLTDGLRGRPLDLFVQDALHEVGFWRGKSSDDLAAHRVVEAGPDKVRLMGRMWEVGAQQISTFWLDIERDPNGSGDYAFTLYSEIVVASPCQERNAWELLSRPEDVSWEVILSGDATASHEGLVIRKAYIVPQEPDSDPDDDGVAFSNEVPAERTESRRSRRRNRRR